MNIPDIHGLLVLDKPAGITSRSAVDRAQRWFPRRTRIGHAGTLDPLATGVLVLCLGSATRLMEYVQRMRKVYRTQLLLGARSDSDDADGVIVPESRAIPPDPTALAACLTAFLGVIEQIPPAYSAAKIAGRRAYAVARRGEEVTLAPRPVQIHAIETMNYTYPLLDLEVQCGKGTYIRSLARDVGERLGCGALVRTLRRLSIGPFRTQDALTLDADAETAHRHLLPMDRAVAEMPRLVLADNEVKRLEQGQAVPAAVEWASLAEETAVFDAAGRLAAVAALDPQRRLLRPIKVLQSK